MGKLAGCCSNNHRQFPLIIEYHLVRLSTMVPMVVNTRSHVITPQRPYLCKRGSQNLCPCFQLLLSLPTMMAWRSRKAGRITAHRDDEHDCRDAGGSAMHGAMPRMPECREAQEVLERPYRPCRQKKRPRRGRLPGCPDVGRNRTSAVHCFGATTVSLSRFLSMVFIPIPWTLARSSRLENGPLASRY